MKTCQDTTEAGTDQNTVMSLKRRGKVIGKCYKIVCLNIFSTALNPVFIVLIAIVVANRVSDCKVYISIFFSSSSVITLLYHKV